MILFPLLAGTMVEGQQPRFQISIEQVIPGEGPGYILVRPVDVIPLSNGQVWVADASDLTIRVFGSDGSYRMAVGRRGQGPGEFRSLRGLGWLADTLYVVDAENIRASFFDPQGALVREHRLPQLLGGDVFAPFRFTPTGILGTPQLTRDAFRTASEARFPLILVSFDGGAADTVAYLDLSGIAVVVNAQGREIMITGHGLTRLVRPGTPWTISADGRYLLRVERTRGLPVGQDWFLSVVSLRDRQEVRRHIIPYDPRRVPRDVVDSLYQSMTVHLRGIPEDAALDILRQSLPRPEWYPPVTRVLASRDGSTFIELGESTPTGMRWSVLGRDGGLVGTFDLPHGIRLETVVHVSRELWAIRHDDDGVPEILRLSLRPASN
ncbi:MAG: 6-bladed beta-propeller [Gemmatimonadales bacterium]